MATVGKDIADGIINSSTAVKTKQQKKEEGRIRALEISIATPNNSTGTKSKRTNRKSARHGARNQHRHKNFAKWILQTFPHILNECIEANQNEINKTTQQMHILDVAGGKGELSARLSLCHSLRVVMIDPRPADIESVYMNSVVPKLPNKWQTSVEEKMKHTPSFVQDMLEKRFFQLIMPFTSPSCNSTPTTHDDKQDSYYKDDELDTAVRNASLLIGLHSDGATEAIVDAALLYQKPFVIVPCCVFPNLFRERYINVVDSDNNDTNTTSGAKDTLREKKVPVRTHDQFCEYLLAKDSRFKKEVLPFEGRNVAIYWDGNE